MDEKININKHKYIYIYSIYIYIYVNKLYIYIFKYLSRTWHYGTSSWSSSGSLVMASLQTMIVKEKDSSQHVTVVVASLCKLLNTRVTRTRQGQTCWLLLVISNCTMEAEKPNRTWNITEGTPLNAFKYMCNYVFWSHWPDSPEVPLLQEGVLYSVVHSTLPPVCSESEGSCPFFGWIFYVCLGARSLHEETGTGSVP